MFIIKCIHIVSITQNQDLCGLDRWTKPSDDPITFSNVLFTWKKNTCSSYIHEILVAMPQTTWTSAESSHDKM